VLTTERTESTEKRTVRDEGRVSHGSAPMQADLILGDRMGIAGAF
jgi:hypothetical protein